LFASQVTQPAAAAATTQLPEAPRIVLTAGRSRVVGTDFEIVRVAITDPAIADATVVGPRELLIDGKAAGTVSLIIWGDRERVQYDVVVDPGVPRLQQTLQGLFPGEEIQVTQTEQAVVLTGRVSGNDIMLRAAEVAAATVPAAKIINLLQLPGGIGSQQVMLQVRIAEVNRRAVEELGANGFTNAIGVDDTIVRGTTQQFPSVEYQALKSTYQDGKLVSSEGQMLFSDFLNLFILSNKYKVGMLIRALQSSGNFQSLAEPNLIAYNGQEATFLAGGEFPVPVVQSAGAGAAAVSIVFREFGVRLSFTPTIAGDVIKLKVRPEVSALDFASGVTLGGFRVPALTTRRAETMVELRDGQSFAIAGLLSNFSQENTANVPFLSKIPIIGYLFKTKAERQERTELLVLVTPQLVRPLNPDEVPPLPITPGRFLPPGDGTTPKPNPNPPEPKPGGGVN